MLTEWWPVTYKVIGHQPVRAVTILWQVWKNGATYICDYHDPCWLLWYTMIFNSQIVHWLILVNFLSKLFVYMLEFQFKPLKDRSRIYTGPTSAANRGSTHLRRTKSELVPHSPRSWPALEPRLCPIAGRRKSRFNREVSEPRLCQELQAAFPVWVPRFQATGPTYTSRKSCVHTFTPYSTCLIGNLPVFS